jgi:hypothetical protein
VIDHGAPGTGHQIAVLRLLDKLSEAGYPGAVDLYYQRTKTSIYAERLGHRAPFASTPANPDPAAPAASWRLFHEQWVGSHKGLTVTCHPLGAPVASAPSVLAHLGYDLQRYWTEIAWPGAPGLPAPAPAAAGPTGAVPPPPPPMGPGAKPKNQLTDEERRRFLTGSPALATLQEAFQSDVLATAVAQGHQLRPADLQAHPAPVGPVLTMFAAFDEVQASGRDYFSDGPESWLAAIVRLTGQADPVTVILQPFLWGKTVQVRRGAAVVADLKRTIEAAGGVPVYSAAPKPEPADLDQYVRAAHAGTATVNPDAVAAILRRAKAKQIELVTVYYTTSSGEIDYSGVIRAIYWAYGYAAKTPDQPLVVALLGDEPAEGITQPGERISVTLLDVAAGSAPDPLSGTVRPMSEGIYVVRVGRTPVMDLFQRYAGLVVTEGANTWQEVLTLGRPALTVRTTETRPWLVPLAGGTPDAKMVEAARMVEAASQALVRQSGSNDQPGPSDSRFRPLVDFVAEAARPRSALTAYFQTWATALGKPESDQFAQAMAALATIP